MGWAGVDSKLSTMATAGLDVVGGAALLLTPFAAIGAGMIGSGVGSLVLGEVSEELGGSYELGAFVGNLVGGVAGSAACKYSGSLPKRLSGSLDLDAKISVKKSNHANSLTTDKPAQGYTLRDRHTGEILKYGETTMGPKRYTNKYLDSINARIFWETSGTKKEMHLWQHNKILDYIDVTGVRPLNKSLW